MRVLQITETCKWRFRTFLHVSLSRFWTERGRAIKQNKQIYEEKKITLSNQVERLQQTTCFE